MLLKNRITEQITIQRDNKVKNHPSPCCGALYLPPDKNSSGRRVTRSTCVATDPAYSSIIGQS
jgi:hypothetical protein